MFDLFSQNEVANYETAPSEALCRHLGADASAPIPLPFPSVPCSPSAFGKARAERVGVPRDEGPPTKTPEVLGALSHVHPLLLWSKWNVSSWRHRA